MPLPDQAAPHNRELITSQLMTLHPDLQEIPLRNPDLTIFVDGSPIQGINGKFQAGYAITDQFELIE